LFTALPRPHNWIKGIEGENGTEREGCARGGEGCSGEIRKME